MGAFQRASFDELEASETLGSCPKCMALVSMDVRVGLDHIEYFGECPSHGAFVRKRGRSNVYDVSVSFADGE